MKNCEFAQIAFVESYTVLKAFCFLLFKLKCILPDIVAVIRSFRSEELGLHGFWLEITVYHLVDT